MEPAMQAGEGGGTGTQKQLIHSYAIDCKLTSITIF